MSNDQSENLGKLEALPKGPASVLTVPSRSWPRPSQMRGWMKAGQETEKLPITHISSVAKNVCLEASADGRAELLSKLLPEKMDFVPAACKDADGRIWNLLDMAILTWDQRALTTALSRLDCNNHQVRLQMGESLTRSHDLLNRGKSAGLPYMPIESKFARSLLILVAAGAQVEKPYWDEPRAAHVIPPRGVFANGESLCGIVAAAVHTLPDQIAAQAIKNLSSQGYEIDRLNEHDRSTALHLACRRGMLTTIETLLELGANPARKAKNGWNADSFAKAGKQPAALQMLDAYRAKVAVQRAILYRAKSVP